MKYTKERYWLTEAEVAKLLEYRSANYSEHSTIALITLLLNTGLSTSELTGLRWVQLFKYKNNYILKNIPTSHSIITKNILVLQNNLQRVHHWKNLTSIYDITYVFPCNVKGTRKNRLQDKPLSLRTKQLKIKRHCIERLGSALQIKNFKDTYIRYAIEQKIPLLAINKALGHISLQRTEQHVKRIFYQLDKPELPLVTSRQNTRRRRNTRREGGEREGVLLLLDGVGGDCLSS